MSRLPASPARPSNGPGLSAIRYRIGTFATFRRAMLDNMLEETWYKLTEESLASLRAAGVLAAVVAKLNALKANAPEPRDQFLRHLSNILDSAELAEFQNLMLDKARPSPFAGWNEGSDDDYQTMFIEVWAYLADILSFYQERIANEAFLPTATRRDSLLRLARLVGYRATPGAGASVLLAFFVQKSKTVAIPEGFRTGSSAAPGRPACVFETAEAIAAVGALSSIPLAAAEPVDQLFDLQRETDYQVVLQGASNRLSVGAYVLIVESEGEPNEQQTLRQIADVAVDQGANTTTISWREPGPGFADPTLYALRVSAGPFGNNAPMWQSLPVVLTRGQTEVTTTHTGAAGAATIATTTSAPGAAFPDNWDDPTKPTFYLSRPDETDSSIDLDSVFDTVRATPERPNWAVLLTEAAAGQPQGTLSLGGKMYTVFRVTGARSVGRTAFAVSAKVTRLSVTGPALPKITFPLRGTSILTGADRLTLVDRLPVQGPLTGQDLLLDGQFPQLALGQRVIVQGPDADTGEAGAEDGVIAAVVVHAENDLTTVTLRRPLAGSYRLAGTVVCANIALATQGETVRDEILGSGDGTAFQTFTLKKAPLTYLATTDAASIAAVQSTLAVTVNGVRWQELPALAGAAPDARIFTATQDNTGATTLEFGDGFFGARPGSGLDNIKARYRKGSGLSGNVPAGAVAQLLDTRPGLQRVTNPAPAVGGADSESAEHIRTNVPANLQAFGRAVCVIDYASLALGYPGVTKASAAWVQADPARPGAIVQPYLLLTIATNDPSPAPQQTLFVRALRAYLDQRRDQNVPLRIGSYSPVYLEVAAQIDVDDRYPRQATVAAAGAALRPGLNPNGQPGFFAFDRLQFGASIRLADVYAALQRVPGVRSAAIVTFRRRDQDSDPRTVRNVIAVGPTELAVVANDPANPARGTLTLAWRSGGFLDT